MMTSPPRPPSPPEGPPRGTNFSRRKATQPLPPSPAFTRIRASSINMASLFQCSGLFLPQNHPGNSLQVVYQGDACPTMHEILERGTLAVTNLQHQPAPGLEHPGCLRDQALIHFEAG